MKKLGAYVNWAQHMRAKRSTALIGRTAERRLFQHVINATSLPYQILSVVGPGGAGKTSLLKIFDHECIGIEICRVMLDARTFRPSPDDFTSALSKATEIDVGPNLWKWFADQGRSVLFIDNFDDLFPICDWLCDSFFPNLPQSTLVVTAGRNTWPEPWNNDPVWKDLVHTHFLDNFLIEECGEYLSMRGLPETEHRKIINFSHGHPLTLSLIADMYNQRPNFTFDREASPDIVQTLVRRFTGDVSKPSYRHALQACSLVRVMTESLLADMLEVDDAGEPFEWLCGLSFIELSPSGIYPHELTRDVLALDLQWRHTERFDMFRERAHHFYRKRLNHPNDSIRHEALKDFMYLHRHHDIFHSLLGQHDGFSILPKVETALPSDHAHMVGLIRKFEGDTSATLAKQWLKRQPEGARIVRNTDGEVEAFILILRFQRQTEQVLTPYPDHSDAKRPIDDPIVQAIHTYLGGENPERKPLIMPGEVATMTRFGADSRTYQRPSPNIAALTVELVRDFLTTPHVKFTFNAMANPEEWQNIADSLGFFARLDPFSFQEGKQIKGIFMQDWRKQSPVQWLTRITPTKKWRGTRQHVRKNVHTNLPLTVAPVDPNPSLVDRKQWTRYIRHALRSLHTPDVLKDNPLIHFKIVRKQATTFSEEISQSTQTIHLDQTGHIEALQKMITDIVHQFSLQRGREKAHRALFYTYIEPAGKQERVAEYLDIPFSTYRDHLRTGIDILTKIILDMEEQARNLIND